MTMQDKWGHSGDGEMYYGDHNTKEEAIEAGRAEDAAFVGQYRAPSPPWNAFDAGDFIDDVLDHDDYSGDWADGCLDMSPAQKKDFEQHVRKAIREWFEKNEMIPEFGVVEHEERIQ